MPLKTNLLLFVAKAAIGIRTFSDKASLEDNSRGKKSPDWLTRIWDWGTGFLSKGWDYLMSNFASIIMGAAQTLWQFDWARTDDMIIKDIENTNKLFGQQLGRMGAAGLVRNAKIGMPKMGKMKWPTLDPVVLANIEEENKEELEATLNGAMTAIKSGLTRNFMNLTFISGRFLLGLSPKAYTEPWSLAAGTEKFAEWADKTIPIAGGAIKGFIEQLEDDLFEVGYLATSGIQSSYAMSKAAIRDSRGKERIIKYYPDSTDKSVFTFVSGSTEDIRNTVSTEMAVSSGMGMKSVGMVVQTSLDTSMKASMGLRMITCYFNASANGGSVLPDGKRAPQKILEIKNVKVSVDYDKLKTALRPIDGGYIKVIAFLSDGHQLQGFFTTEAEGKGYFRPIIENICIGDLVRWQHIPADENIKKRPVQARFVLSSVTVQIRKETNDERQKRFIDAGGKMYKVAIKNRIKFNGVKPDKIDAWFANPFPTTVA